jgi:hypothetical protein
MTQKLSRAQAGAATVLALRLPPAVAAALTAVTAAEQARLSVRARLSRSAVARALLAEALHARGALGGGTAPAPAPAPPTARGAPAAPAKRPAPPARRAARDAASPRPAPPALRRAKTTATAPKTPHPPQRARVAPRGSARRRPEK